MTQEKGTLAPVPSNFESSCPSKGGEPEVIPMNRDRDSQPMTAELSAWMLQPNYVAVAARIHLLYDSSDPYAVTMAVCVQDQKPIRWMFSRELLDDGLRQPSGIGDVTITPCPQAPTAMLHVKLRDDIFAADLEMRSLPVTEFLRLSYLQVPAGTEGLFVLIEDDVSVAETRGWPGDIADGCPANPVSRLCSRNPDLGTGPIP
jgi:hypothetical protein